MYYLKDLDSIGQLFLLLNSIIYNRLSNTTTFLPMSLYQVLLLQARVHFMFSTHFCIKVQFLLQNLEKESILSVPVGFSLQFISSTLKTVVILSKLQIEHGQVPKGQVFFYGSNAQIAAYSPKKFVKALYCHVDHQNARIQNF
jgi:hypothetical protein